jgi:hypothetical protein
MAEAHIQRPITPREAERAELAILGVDAWIEALDAAAEADTKGEVTT